MGLFFDSPPSSQQETDPIPPLWMVDIENEEDVLTWGKKVYDVLEEFYRDRDKMIYESIGRYLGKYVSVEPRSGDRTRMFETPSSRNKDFPKVITNQYKALVEQKVAMQVKYKPATDLIPDSWGEYKDKMDAKVGKKFLQGVKEFNHADLLWPRFARRAILAGQAFILPYWNPRAGRRVGNKTRDFSLKNKAGDTFSFSAPEYSGEISFRFPLTQHVRLFPAQDADHCLGMMIISFPDVWSLRMEYPEKQDDIKPGKDLSYFDYDRCEYVNLENSSLCLEFYIRSCDACPDGLYMKMTPDVVLEMPQENPVPINDDARESLQLGDLPVVWLPDTELDGDVNGYPSTLDIFHLQHIYDKLTTHFVMNVAYFCNPKWTAQKNSVKLSAFENLPGLILEHTGTVAPTLQVFNAITQDQFALRAAILEGMEQTFGVYSVSRGAPPPGTRAAAQLYYYDEQEAQLNAPFKRKFDHATETLDSICLALMAKHYTNDKERLVYILGDDKRWIAESLDVSSLRRRFTVRSQAGTNMPDSKYGRINALMEVYSMNPNQATWSQLMEMLDNGQQEKLIDNSQQAVLAAEYENERLQKGEDIDPPTMYEFLIDHWMVHSKLVQSPEYKEQKPDIKRKVENHIGGTELLMIALSQTNPIFAQKLPMLPQFPLFAQLPPPNPMAMQQQAMAPQAAPAARERSRGIGPAEALGLPGDEQLNLQQPG